MPFVCTRSFTWMVTLVSKTWYRFLHRQLWLEPDTWIPTMSTKTLYSQLRISRARPNLTTAKFMNFNETSDIQSTGRCGSKVIIFITQDCLLFFNLIPSLVTFYTLAACSIRQYCRIQTTSRYNNALRVWRMTPWHQSPSSTLPKKVQCSVVHYTHTFLGELIVLTRMVCTT